MIGALLTLAIAFGALAVTKNAPLPKRGGGASNLNPADVEQVAGILQGQPIGTTLALDDRFKNASEARNFLYQMRVALYHRGIYVGTKAWIDPDAWPLDDKGAKVKASSKAGLAAPHFGAWIIVGEFTLDEGTGASVAEVQAAIDEREAIETDPATVPDEDGLVEVPGTGVKVAADED